MTPRKVNFKEDTDQGLEKKHGKSFIEMISPIKKRYSIEYTSQELADPQPSVSKNLNKTFTRKNMNESMLMVKNMMISLAEEGQEIKQKTHTLAVEIRPLLKYIEDGSNGCMAQ